MINFQDQNYLRKEQYRDASNLNARIQLHQHFSTNPYGWFRWAFDQFRFPSNARILELGCGPGSIWAENQPRIPQDWAITLTDFSNGMLCQARNEIGEKQQFTWVSSNAMAIPFADESFDEILANHMLYHIPDLQRALKEINRVLRSGGSLFAATNGENHLKELDELMEESLQPQGLHYSRFITSFTLENGLKQLTPWFTEINTQYYRDGLHVTESEPLLAYIQSLVPRSNFIDEELLAENINATVNQKISQSGSFDIQKSTGMFICIK